MIRHRVSLLWAAIAVAMLTSPAAAQQAIRAAKPWPLAPNTGYGYDRHFKTWQYRLGTNNAGLLLKGARKVPKNTLFFIGANGRLYMRTGPFLDGDGNFMFGPS